MMQLGDLPMMACTAALEFDHDGVVGPGTRLLIARLEEFDSSDPVEAMRFVHFFEDIGQKPETITELDIMMGVFITRLRAALDAADDRKKAVKDLCALSERIMVETAEPERGCWG